MTRVVVVGGGVGGLVAAGLCAARGCRVTLLEAHERVGGKAGTAILDGVPFDTGPSVLTLPDVFESVLRELGRDPAAEVRWIRPDPAFRYVWPDGVSLDVAHDPQRTVASVARVLGKAASEQLALFLRYAERIWAAAGPRFVRGPAPSIGGLLSLAAVRDLAAIDPLRTMGGAILSQVEEPHVRDVLLRYATYNGSDPRRAPATLNCIAWVELGLGGFGVDGGIGALVGALERAVVAAGVEVRCGTPARGLLRRGGAVVGVETDGGALEADAVVANHEAVVALSWAGRRGEAPSSTSGWNAIVRTPRAERAAHTVVFPAVYDQEFEDLFDRGRPPVDPTVYACAPRLCHANPGWSDGEGVFLMANAPAVDGPSPCDELRERVLARAVAAGVVAADAPVVWERTPSGLAERFPGSRGALYGAASNDAMAAFRRPANRVPGVPGLYLASGSAHPGGGLPLVALSGRAAADALCADAGRS